MMQLQELSSARPAEFTVRGKPLYSGSDPKELLKGNLNTKVCADLIQLLIGMNLSKGGNRCLRGRWLTHGGNLLTHGTLLHSAIRAYPLL